MKVLVRRSMRIGLVFVDKREGSRITDSVKFWGWLRTDYIDGILKDESRDWRIELSDRGI